MWILDTCIGVLVSVHYIYVCMFVSYSKHGVARFTVQKCI